MKARHLLAACAVLLAACDTKAKQQLSALAHADSLRTDSLVSIKNELLNEVMTSSQFVNGINDEMAKLKAKRPAKLTSKVTAESDAEAMKEERAAVMARIKAMVARLDSSENRVASLRSRVAKLAQHDSTLVAQVAAYEKNVQELRETVERQKAEYEGIIATQKTQIASLASKVDTMTSENTRLSSEKTALADTVTHLSSELNTVYYVIGTKSDLVRQGILVEEGHKRFVLVGGRTVSPARDLDATKFKKIDRLRDRTITFPEGQYTIFTRQSLSFASPIVARDGKISGGLKIDQPEQFWGPSKFLIIVKS
jgi:predicted  nucleic acid-binding Zn-ribbon protein